MSRDRIRKELLRYSRLVVKAGFVIGTGGNLSARVGNIIYLTARDADLSSAKASNFVKYDLRKDRLISLRPPTHEVELHLGCFKARPDIGAVIHVHPPLVLALPNKGAIKPDYYELKATVKTDIPVLGDLPAASQRLATAVAKNIKAHNALVLANHGIVTVGKTLEEAFVRAQALERMALVLILRRVQEF